MSGRPQIFNTSKAGSSAKAAPTTKYGPSTRVAPPSKDARGGDHHSKRRKITLKTAAIDASTEHPASKSPVYSTDLPPTCLCEQMINAADIKEYEARHLADQRAAAKKAAAELIMYNLISDNNLNALGTRLEASDNSKKALKKELKDLKARMKLMGEEKVMLEKDRSEATSSLAFLAAEKDTLAKELQEQGAAHDAELERIKYEWEAEKGAIEEAAGVEGFGGYLRTFIAGDPEYNWAAPFGEEMASWIEYFKVVEVAAIAEKKLEMEQQKASTPQTSSVLENLEENPTDNPSDKDAP